MISMAVGDKITIQKMEDGEWVDYAHPRIIQANKTKSTEYVTAGGEQNAAHVTFRVRFVKKLMPIETDMPSYRIVWHGTHFDIRGYDDYMYQHRTVNLAGVSYG